MARAGATPPITWGVPLLYRMQGDLRRMHWDPSSRVTCSRACADEVAAVRAASEGTTQARERGQLHSTATSAPQPGCEQGRNNLLGMSNRCVFNYRPVEWTGSF